MGHKAEEAMEKANTSGQSGQKVEALYVSALSIITVERLASTAVLRACTTVGICAIEMEADDMILLGKALQRLGQALEQE